jgi:hypothetical protein
MKLLGGLGSMSMVVVGSFISNLFGTHLFFPKSMFMHKDTSYNVNDISLPNYVIPIGMHRILTL